MTWENSLDSYKEEQKLLKEQKKLAIPLETALAIQKVFQRHNVDMVVHIAEQQVMRAKRAGIITELDEADFFSKTAILRDANAGLPPSSFGYGQTCGDSCHDEEDPSRSEIQCHKGHSTKGHDKNLSK